METKKLDYLGQKLEIGDFIVAQEEDDPLCPNSNEFNLGRIIEFKLSENNKFAIVDYSITYENGCPSYRENCKFILKVDKNVAMKYITKRTLTNEK